MVGSGAGLLGALGPALGVVGAFATFVLEHPKDKYHSEITSIKENRLNDVCNALGPIISDCYDFAKTDDDSAHEELEQSERATVAVANSITPPDDVPPLQEAIQSFNEPERVYTRCRNAYYGSYILFFLAISSGAIPIIPEITGLESANYPMGMQILSGVSIVLLFVGILSILYFIYLNQRLDGMAESANFTLDS